MIVKNRCIMAPLSASLCNTDGSVSEELIAYFNARAEGGVGLIFTEYAFVAPNGRSCDQQISVATDDMIPGLQRLVESVHKRDAKIALQLQHGGRRSIVELTAPSPMHMAAGQATPRVYTTGEVYALINDFILAAERAQKAGFDLVEVHCAHGYLLNDFVSPRANRRTDEFGGNVAGRARVATEIIKGIKKALGNEYPVSVRMSAEEMVADGHRKRDSAAMAQLFEEAGADLVNVSCGVSGVGRGIAPAARETGHNVEAAEEMSRVVGIPVAVAGRINEPEYAEAILRSGKVSFVAIGRALFADPNFMKKAAEGREDEIAPCVACLQRCYGNYNHGGVFRSCMINPFAMRETTMTITPAKDKKRIMVIGAGPAGLETAWIAAARGHQVTVYDKNDMPGGQFRIAAVPPHKQLLARAIIYYATMCRKHGAELIFNTEVTREMVLEQNPDTVVVATGGTPIVPRIPGIEDANVLYGHEVLMGAPVKGKRVIIIGGGAQGAEAADHLSQYGHDVAVVEMRGGVALDDPEAVRELLLQRLNDHGVKLLTNTTVKHIYPDGIDGEVEGQVLSHRGYDQVVVSIGVRSFNPLVEELKNGVAELLVVGDALAAKDAVEAIYKGALTRMGL